MREPETQGASELINFLPKDETTLIFKVQRLLFLREKKTLPGASDNRHHSVQVLFSRCERQESSASRLDKRRRGERSSSRMTFGEEEAAAFELFVLGAEVEEGGD